MGGNSESKPVAANDQINEVTTGGFHMVEIHLPTIGAGVFVLLLAGSAVYVAYRCVKKMRAPQVARRPELHPGHQLVPYQTPQQYQWPPQYQQQPQTVQITLEPRLLAALTSRRPYQRDRDAWVRPSGPRGYTGRQDADEDDDDHDGIEEV